MQLVLVFNPSGDKISNFSLQYNYLMKHTGHENKENDHQRKMIQMFKHIPQHYHRKYVYGNHEENIMLRLKGSNWETGIKLV